MGAADCTASGPEVDGITRVWCRRGSDSSHGAAYQKHFGKDTASGRDERGPVREIW